MRGTTVTVVTGPRTPRPPAALGRGERQGRGGRAVATALDVCRGRRRRPASPVEEGCESRRVRREGRGGLLTREREGLIDSEDLRRGRSRPGARGVVVRALPRPRPFEPSLRPRWCPFFLPRTPTFRFLFSPLLLLSAGVGCPPGFVSSRRVPGARPGDYRSPSRALWPK